MQRDFVEPGSGPRRRLWAETIGCRVPRIDCTGRVAAVFERACNVTLEGGGLVTLLAPDAGNVAHGIRLAGNQRLERRLRSGMSLRLADDRAIFDGGTVTVMLSAARTWTPRLRPGSCDWNGRSLRAALQVRDLLREHAGGGSSEFLASVLRSERAAAPLTPLGARVSAILPRLALAARAREPKATPGLIAQLIGLGPGLTPAGDDFTIGWLAGLTLLTDTHARHGFLQAICAQVEVLRQATSSVSSQHLEDACELLFSERLLDVCVAIADGAAEPTLASRVAAQLAVGATSGADAAAGLMFALFECGLPARR